MLTHPLVERLRGLGLTAMADAFLEMQAAAVAADLSREDWLGLLLDREATSRENKRLSRRLTQARLRQSAVIEDTDFRTARGLDRALFLQLGNCDWLRQSQNLIICGKTGTGKSWLACALGHKACREGFSVLYRRAPRLFAELATARGEGRLARLLTTLERTRLLIIDDWGPEPLNAEQRRDLLEIVDDRHEKGSLLVTSQIPVKRWHELIADPTLGDAILDRVVHRSHRIDLTGPSLRKRNAVSTPADTEGSTSGSGSTAGRLRSAATSMPAKTAGTGALPTTAALWAKDNDLHFGAKSERLVVLVDEQMILGLDDVATDATPLPPPANDDAAAKPKTPARPSTKPARRNIGALPKHLPRCEGSVPGVALQPVVAAADIA